MANPSSFLIYNASAGSGKTFTLVKEYLKVLFKSQNPSAFKNILAITFTNKASAEMKSRVIDALVSFSKQSDESDTNPMFEQICQELDIPKSDLRDKSALILDAIIHNYAAFDISTIDGFVHKLIKTFAYDLKLPLNFEVELDTNSLLLEAVDRLISKAGSNDKLTKVLVDYALEKADDDKSWDISKDLYAISKLLLNENDIYYLKTLKDKTLDDFKTLKSNTKRDLKIIENTIVEKANVILTLISEAGLVSEDFKGKYLPRHFENLTSKNFDINFSTAWQTDLIEGNKLYPTRVSEDVASIIESIQPQLAEAYIDTKTLVFRIKFLQALYKNITPLSVLNEIQKELEEIKIEQNVILISEFNSLISKEIKDQPTPFIYERSGERFKHYFIDEFQDTSQLQWENLIPLMDNALSSEKGSAMIVGDAKQAIYRWRGGKAEQFMDLFNKTKNPFFVDPQIISLEANFRSSETIVEFNNRFFEYLSENFFSDHVHRELYKNSNQQSSSNNTGYVSLDFLEINSSDDKDLIYAQKTLDKILDCLDQGYALNDICVLVRKKKEGLSLAEFLNASGIKIMSSETLLINNSIKVRFIVALLKLLSQPNNLEIKADLLNSLIVIFNIENKHDFLKEHINLDLKILFKSLESIDCQINFDELPHLSLYDLVETIVRSFRLVEKSDAYVQYFMDVVLEFSNRQKADLQSFLEYFENQSDKLSIIAPEGYDAVQIMTIHKSKGLEFPIVIFPYADLNIYREINPVEWFPLDPKTYNGFSYALLNYSIAFENFGEQGLDIFNKHQSELELDNINLLYVALTRPIEQLYIISKKDISSKGAVNNNTFSGFFISYLQNQKLWNDQTSTYIFGEKATKEFSENSKNNFVFAQEFVSVSKNDNNILIATNSGYLWDTEQKDAIEKGNLFHDIMSHITSKEDVEFAFSDYLRSGKISKTQAVELKPLVLKLVSNPKLEACFDPKNKIYNERDIIAKNNLIIRPDKLVVFPDNTVYLIDYKSGNPNKKHELQLLNYEKVLNDMGFNVSKKILIYINNDIQIKEF
ncbi:DNA helicase UvrD [Hanstruepera neustonica]|uniref:DNA 3'-5' helicase n=1 Tax=Hanstruepera neustonica TaxID=1445657 RepID=A0A2K1E3K7_9FLAO|nr:UvrD-helicase domain-containing protein [Hanstruepera neustonica]PNQ74874.1 DNA helicase UvrD [Hanstruepera neustonica]